MPPGSPRTRFTSAIASALLIATTGCGAGTEYEYEYEYDDDPGTGAAAPAAGVANQAAPGTSQRPVTAQEITGHWVSDPYGDAYFQVTGTVAKIVYGTEGGRMVGTLTGGRFVGWWTEAPTRAASEDAGEAEFSFSRGGGGLIGRGRWRGGTTGEYETDWVITKVDGEVPATVRSTFADQSQFIRHP